MKEGKFIFLSFILYVCACSFEENFLMKLPERNLSKLSYILMKKEKL